MKIKRVKLANAIRVGQEELLFLGDDKFDLCLEAGVLIRVRDKRNGKEAVTSLFNTIYFEDDKSTTESNSSVRRTSAK